MHRVYRRACLPMPQVPLPSEDQLEAIFSPTSDARRSLPTALIPFVHAILVYISVAQWRPDEHGVLREDAQAEWKALDAAYGWVEGFRGDRVLCGRLKAVSRLQGGEQDLQRTHGQCVDRPDAQKAHRGVPAHVLPGEAGRRITITGCN